jgi:hypothetical protein
MAAEPRHKAKSGLIFEFADIRWQGASIQYVVHLSAFKAQFLPDDIEGDIHLHSQQRAP